MYKHKRGDTFSMVGVATITDEEVPVASLAGWAGACQIRRSGFSDVIQFTWIDAVERRFSLYDNATHLWPLGPVNMDIQFTSPSGTVVSTQTMSFEIVEDVTYVEA